MEDKSDLESLKENYAGVQEKHGLPDFESLNEDFNIEKISEIETDFLVRGIRKFMSDKFSNYLRFIEALLNPVNAPMFVFSIVKSIGNEEKKKLTEIYKKLAKLEVDLIELDVKYSEEKEIAFVKDSYEVWQGIKESVLEIVGVIKENWNNKGEVNGKGYFG